jgi:DNA primase
LLSTHAREDLEEILASAPGYLPFLLSLVQERGEQREQKERALRQALKSIANVQDPIRQEYLLQEASELFGISLEILHGTIAQARDKRHAAPEMPEDGKAKLDRRSPPNGGERTSSAGVRDFAQVNRPAIEATLMAHVLRDRSGKAAALLLNQGSGIIYSTPTARLLLEELEHWRTAVTGGRKVAPADFLQERWNSQSAQYRRYVSDLLTKEVVPDQTDFDRVIQDCLTRLLEDQRRRQS